MISESISNSMQRPIISPSYFGNDGIRVRLNYYSNLKSFDNSSKQKNKDLYPCYQQSDAPPIANRINQVQNLQPSGKINFNYCQNSSKLQIKSHQKQPYSENHGNLQSTLILKKDEISKNQNLQQIIDSASLKQQVELLTKENLQLQSQLKEKEHTNNQLIENLNTQKDEIYVLQAQILELNQKQVNYNDQISQLKIKLEQYEKEYIKISEENKQFLQQLEEEKNQKYVFYNQYKELLELSASQAKQLEEIKQQQFNQQNYKTNNSFYDDPNTTADLSYLLNEKNEILGKTTRCLCIQSNILSIQFQNYKKTEKQIIKDLINLSNQYQLQQIKSEQFIETIIKILHPPLPISLVLGQAGVGKTKLLKQLFNFPDIKEFIPILHADLDCYFVDTMGFDFKSDIDKREQQISMFKKLFNQYPNKVANIFIVVNFERTDMMKNKLAEVNRYFKKFKDKISLIITNFDLSEDIDQDKQHLMEYLPFYKNQVLIFTGKKSTEQQIVESLKPILAKQNENQIYPFDLKDTFFEEEDENETNEILNRLNQQFQQ